MAHQSIRELRAQVKRRLLAPEDRFVAAKLDVRDPDGNTVFVVGGCWDRLAREYVDRPCDAHVVTLQVSQVPMARAVGVWLEQRHLGDLLRVALMLAIGNRGGGKTFLCGLLMVVFALAFPGRWQIGISITAKQNRELKTAIEMVSPPAWITQDVTDLRDPYTEFVTGSTVLWLTARNPKVLRQALMPFELVVINEGQDQAEVVFANAIHAIRSGGLVVVATNPPQEDAGDWITNLYNGIAAGEPIRLEAGDAPVDTERDGVAFVLHNKDNKAVSQSTLGKIGRLLRLVNPDAADADSEGIIKLSGHLGYPGFTKLPRKVDVLGRWLSGHVGDPERIDIGARGRSELLYRYGLKDVTRELTAAALGSEFGVDYVGGGDFQTEPGSCCPVGKIFRLPYMTPAGDLLLWIKEFVATRGTEQDLTLALNERGYFPTNVDYDGNAAHSLLLVGDATGARQNAEHRKRDPYSFARLRADGWKVLPPAYYGPKRTPWNPLVAESRKQMKALASVGLVMISPACAEAPEGFPALTESFVRAKVTPDGKFIKKGHHTHGPDGVRYLAWRFLWRPRPMKPSGSLSPAFDTLSGTKPKFGA